MFDIYIKNYTTRAGVFVNNETLFYSIPMEQDEPNVVIDPKVTCDMGKAGTFEFSMNPGHPYFESLMQMKTMFRVVYDGETIFRGRVITIDVSQFTGTKKVHCEGDFAFFLDSVTEGINDADRKKTNMLTYLQRLIAEHNEQMGDDDDKKFVLGEVPGQYSNDVDDAQKVKTDEDKKYGSSSWGDVQKALTTLSDDYGGYFRTRFQNGIAYIDWFNGYFNKNVNDQVIEIGRNLIDITSDSEVNNIFTVLIPIGSKNSKPLYIDGYKTDIHGNNKEIRVPQIVNVFTDEELNSGFHKKEDYLNAIDKYGMIYKAESFENANTKEKLWEYAVDWIKTNYNGGIDSFSISALDMHMIGENTGKILCGDRVTIRYPNVDIKDSDPYAVTEKTITVMGANYSLHSPETNQYKMGIPNNILKKKYGEKAKSSSGRAVDNEKENNNTYRLTLERAKYTDNELWSFVMTSEINPEKYNTYVKKYGKDAGEAVLIATKYVVENGVNRSISDYSNMLDFLIMDGHTGQVFVNPTAPYNKEFADQAKQSAEIAASIILNGDKSQIDILKAPDADNPVFLQDPVQRTIISMQQQLLKDTHSGKTTAGGKITVGTSDSLSSVINAGMEGVKGEMKAKVMNVYEKATGAAGVFAETAKESLSLNGNGATITGNNVVENPITGDVLSTPEFQLSGQNGTGKFGNSGIPGIFKTTVNDTVTYTDAFGNVHTSDGFISASDMKLNGGLKPIDSFQTKMAVIDETWITKANVDDLNAVVATIGKITANTISANTSLSASVIRGESITGSNIVSTGTLGGVDVVATNFYYAGTGPDGRQKITEKFLKGIGNSEGVNAYALVSASEKEGNIDLHHHHKLTITEVTSGDHKGQMKVELGETINTSDDQNVCYFNSATSVTPSLSVAGWKVVQSGNDDNDRIIQNVITATNPYNQSKFETLPIDPPTVSVEIVGSQAVAKMSDGVNEIVAAVCDAPSGDGEQVAPTVTENGWRISGTENKIISNLITATNPKDTKKQFQYYVSPPDVSVTLQGDQAVAKFTDGKDEIVAGTCPVPASGQVEIVNDNTGITAVEIDSKQTEKMKIRDKEHNRGGYGAMDFNVYITLSNGQRFTRRVTQMTVYDNYYDSSRYGLYYLIFASNKYVPIPEYTLVYSGPKRGVPDNYKSYEDYKNKH